MRLVALLAGLSVAALADHSLARYSPVMDLDCATLQDRAAPSAVWSGGAGRGSRHLYESVFVRDEWAALERNGGSAAAATTLPARYTSAFWVNLAGLAAPTLLPSSCNAFTNFKAKCDLDGWHKSITNEGLRDGCQFEVATGGGTCKSYCAKQGSECLRAQDNKGGCSLDANHERQSTAGNGCNQQWGDQICVCRAPTTTTTATARALISFTNGELQVTGSGAVGVFDAGGSRFHAAQGGAGASLNSSSSNWHFIVAVADSSPAACGHNNGSTNGTTSFYRASCTHTCEAPSFEALGIVSHVSFCGERLRRVGGVGLSAGKAAPAKQQPTGYLARALLFITALDAAAMLRVFHATKPPGLRAIGALRWSARALLGPGAQEALVRWGSASSCSEHDQLGGSWVLRVVSVSSSGDDGAKFADLFRPADGRTTLCDVLYWHLQNAATSSASSSAPPHDNSSSSTFEWSATGADGTWLSAAEYAAGRTAAHGWSALAEKLMVAALATSSSSGTSKQHTGGSFAPGAVAEKKTNQATLTKVGGSNDPNAKNLKACTGECDNDGQCAVGLKCFQRKDGEAIPVAIPGCDVSTAPNGNWDYCYDPAAPTPSQMATGRSEPWDVAAVARYFVMWRGVACGVDTYVLRDGVTCLPLSGLPKPTYAVPKPTYAVPKPTLAAPPAPSAPLEDALADSIATDAEFNARFVAAGFRVERYCAACTITHRRLLYVRTGTKPANHNWADLFRRSWNRTHDGILNVLNTDFELWGLSDAPGASDATPDPTAASAAPPAKRDVGKRPKISHNAAARECTALGMALCSKAQLCPYGTPYAGGVAGKTDAWVPVNDGADEWLQYGANVNKMRPGPLCSLHSVQYAPDPHPCHTHPDPKNYPDAASCDHSHLFCCGRAAPAPVDPTDVGAGVRGASQLRWGFCDYDVRGVGFPGRCGASDRSGAQEWNGEGSAGRAVSWIFPRCRCADDVCVITDGTLLAPIPIWTIAHAGCGCSNYGKTPSSGGFTLGQCGASCDADTRCHAIEFWAMTGRCELCSSAAQADCPRDRRAIYVKASASAPTPSPTNPAGDVRCASTSAYCASLTKCYDSCGASEGGCYKNSCCPSPSSGSFQLMKYADQKKYARYYVCTGGCFDGCNAKWAPVKAASGQERRLATGRSDAASALNISALPRNDTVLDIYVAATALVPAGATGAIARSQGFGARLSAAFAAELRAADQNSPLLAAAAAAAAAAGASSVDGVSGSVAVLASVVPAPLSLAQLLPAGVSVGSRILPPPPTPTVTPTVTLTPTETRIPAHGGLAGGMVALIVLLSLVAPCWIAFACCMGKGATPQLPGLPGGGGNRAAAGPYRGSGRFTVGATVKVVSKTGKWRDCTVLEARRGAAAHDTVLVHYAGSESRWDEWVSVASARLRDGARASLLPAGSAVDPQRLATALTARDGARYAGLVHSLVHVALPPPDAAGYGAAPRFLRVTGAPSGRDLLVQAPQGAPQAGQAIGVIDSPMGGSGGLSSFGDAFAFGGVGGAGGGGGAAGGGSVQPLRVGVVSPITHGDLELHVMAVAAPTSQHADV
jgi:hypothetical protein